MSDHTCGLCASQALEKLKSGNAAYLGASINPGDISCTIRKQTCDHGQHPYAIVVTCSDSRVIPESIFCAGIGELFTIRIAGNVIDDMLLGSIEYAADHLGTNLILVLGHTNCGAVNAAMCDGGHGYIKSITDEIKEAIGDESDAYKACCLNVHNSVRRIADGLQIPVDGHERGWKVVGGVYHIDDGHVDFI